MTFISACARALFRIDRLRPLTGCLLAILWLQAGVAPGNDLPQAAPTPEFNPEGKVIERVEIEPRNIYSPEEIENNWLLRLANRLHIVTRPRIVRQEVLLDSGDLYSTELAEESARNLRINLPLNDARLELIPLTDSTLAVRVISIDQWSLLGGLRSIERTGGRTNLRFGFEERNFLGRAQFVSFDYFSREGEPNFFTAAFREPRLKGLPLATSLAHRSDPEFRYTSASLGRPFYNLSQLFAFHFTIVNEERRWKRYDVNGDKAAGWTGKADLASTGLALRWGPAFRKFTAAVDYRYVARRISGQERVEPQLVGLAEPVTFPVDSTYHQFEATFSTRYQYFIVLKRINGFAYQEDFTTGYAAGLTYGRVFPPSFDRHLFDIVRVGVSSTQYIGNHLFQASCSRAFWFAPGSGTQRRTQAGLRMYNHGWSHVTFALRSQYVVDESPDTRPLVLSGRSGVRGYDDELSSGDRLHVANFEARIYTGLEIMSVMVGGVLFADAGRTWLEGSPVELSNYYSSLGGGLRFSLERLRRGELVRIDLAIRQDGLLHLLIGTGQFF